MTSQIESFFALTVSRIPEQAKKNSEYYVGDYLCPCCYLNTMVVGVSDDDLFVPADAEAVRGVEHPRIGAEVAEFAPDKKLIVYNNGTVINANLAILATA